MLAGIPALNMVFSAEGSGKRAVRVCTGIVCARSSIGRAVGLHPMRCGGSIPFGRTQ